MIKKYIVKKNYEFKNIINKKFLFKSKNYFIYYIKNNFKYDRFGISVGKKLGNAVVRNKIKRQIRNILIFIIFKKNKINNNLINNYYYDYIIIVRKNYFNSNFLKNKFFLLNSILNINKIF